MPIYLLKLDTCLILSGCTKAPLLMAIMPVALQESAARWWISRIHLPFASWEDLKCHFKAQFLSVHYEMWIMDKLQSQPQHHDEFLIDRVCLQCSGAHATGDPRYFRGGKGDSGDPEVPPTVKSLRTQPHIPNVGGGCMRSTGH